MRAAMLPPAISLLLQSVPQGWPRTARALAGPIAKPEAHARKPEASASTVPHRPMF